MLVYPQHQTTSQPAAVWVLQQEEWPASPACGLAQLYMVLAQLHNVHVMVLHAAHTRKPHALLAPLLPCVTVHACMPLMGP
jgi:hypothetical protein